MGNKFTLNNKNGLRRFFALALAFLLALNILAVSLPKGNFKQASADETVYNSIAVIEAPAGSSVVLELTLTEEPVISNDSNSTVLGYINGEIGGEFPTYHYADGKLACLIYCENDSNVNLFVMSGTDITNLKFAGDTATALTVRSIDTLTSVDVSDSAFLRSLTLSKLPALTAVDASDCALSEIIINEVPTLTSLDCSGNNFTYLTLPTPSAQLTSYTYTPQNDIEIPTYVSSSGFINLTDCHYLAAVGDSAYQTEYLWSLADGTPVPDGSIEMNVAGGYFQVSPELAGETLKCVMTHGAFPALTLTTTEITVVDNLKFFVSPISSTDLSFKVSGEEIPVVYAENADGIIDIITSEFTSANGIYEADALSEYDSLYVTSASPVTELYVSGSYTEEVSVSSCAQLETLSINGGTGAPLNNIDLMLNTALKNLIITNTELEHIGLLANTNLTSVDLSSNNLRTLTFPAGNINIIETLDVSGNRLTALDLASFASLVSLNAESNNLTALDLAACTALGSVDVSENALESVELYDNGVFTYVDVSGNCLTYPTLPAEPLSQANTCEYIYDDQALMELEEIYSVNDEIDLSTYCSDSSGTTTYTLFVNGTQYAQNTTGIFPVTQDMCGYEVYVTAENDMFVDCDMSTGTAYINENLMYKATVSLSSGSVLEFSAITDGRSLYVDWGNGEIVSYPAAGDNNLVSVSGNPIADADGEYYIHLYSAGTVKELDLCYNKEFEGSHVVGIVTASCTDLEVLDISAPEKGEGSNRVSVLDISGNTKLKKLYATNNDIYTLDLSKNTVLVEIDISDNNISKTDLSKNTSVTTLNVSGNELTALDVSKLTSLTSLDCSNNRLTFITLPDDFSGEYTYAPQKYVEIASTVKAEDNVDLSALATVNGKATVYKWINAKTGETVTPTSSNNGVFTFEKGFDSVSAYCEMTNEAFPELTLRTTETVLSSAMTEFKNPIAVLRTSLAAGEEISISVICDDIIYIDWGNGQIVSVSKDVTEIQTSVEDLKGSAVKLYTKGKLTMLSATDMAISSVSLASATDLEFLNLSGNSLKNIDLSKNTKLKTLDLSDNNFALTDLPLISTVTDYSYSPQADYVVPSIKAAGSTIDLSAIGSYQNTASGFAWYKKNSTATLSDDTLLTLGTDYSFSGTGKFILNDSLIGETVYCVITNALFPDFDTKTKGMKTTDVLVTSGGEVTLNDTTGLVYDINIEEGSTCTTSSGTVIAAGDLVKSATASNNTLLTFNSKKFTDTTSITSAALFAKIKALHSSFDESDNCHYIYDFTLLDNKNSEMASFTGNISITLRYPNTTLASKYAEYDFYMFHYITSGTMAGTMEQIPITASSGGLTFTAKSFSPYILVYQADADNDDKKDDSPDNTTSSTPSGTNPDTGDNSEGQQLASAVLWISLAVMVVVAVSSLYVVNRKRNTHR